MSLFAHLVRRRFLAMISLGLLGSRVAILGTLDEPAGVLAHRLVALFVDPSRAHAIGAAYARMLPEEERSVARLTDAVLGGADSHAFRAMRPVIAARIKADFAEGRIVCVDGWLLAQTEARLCAIAALA